MRFVGSAHKMSTLVYEYSPGLVVFRARKGGWMRTNPNLLLAAGNYPIGIVLVVCCFFNPLAGLTRCFLLFGPLDRVYVEYAVATPSNDDGALPELTIPSHDNQHRAESGDDDKEIEEMEQQSSGQRASEGGQFESSSTQSAVAQGTRIRTHNDNHDGSTIHDRVVALPVLDLTIDLCDLDQV